LESTLAKRYTGQAIHSSLLAPRALIRPEIGEKYSPKKVRIEALHGSQWTETEPTEDPRRSNIDAAEKLRRSFR